METILSVTVALDRSRTSADTFDGRYYGTIESYDDLGTFLDRHPVEPGTAIYRFDLTPESAAIDWAVRGPMRKHGLPAGTVQRFAWDNPSPEPWRPGMPMRALDYVSTDVYERLALEAGLVIERAS